jgi:Tol biopolymer transport system component
MEKTEPLMSRIEFGKNIARTGLTCAVLLASAGLVLADDPPQYSSWSAPVNLGPIVNSTGTESGAFISKDGLSLYFGSYNRPGGYGGFDIWVSQRSSVGESWGEPRNLGSIVNTSGNEQTPTLSLDGHLLLFASDYPHPGYSGKLDLYVSRRHNKRDDFGWRTPTNLGSGVNSPFADSGPALFEDDETGSFTLYFSSDRDSPGTEHIYASALQQNETFGPALPVEALNSTLRDARPGIRKDGLEMLLDSNRSGTIGGNDLYVSTRASTVEPWSTPVNLGGLVNSSVLDARPALSFDGTELYFHSDRAGGFGLRNLYRSTRTKLKGKD